MCPHCQQKMTVDHRQPSSPQDGSSNFGHPLVVSVVMPSFNSSTTIRASLGSLMNQDLGQAYEVIVVDSSSDDTPTIIECEFPSVRLIHRTHRTDPGMARNLGVGIARGEIIACLDSDCIAPSNWLSTLVAAHQVGHRIVGGSVKNGNPSTLISWAGYMGEFREFLPVGEAKLVDHVATCNVSYHRSIFERYGGFPPDAYPQEDVVYHARLAQQGLRIWFDPAMGVEHMHRTNWRDYLRHSRRIGRITPKVILLTGREGTRLASSRWLSLVAAPLLPLVKWVRTIGVFWRQQPEILRDYPLALVPFLIGLFIWSAGFVEGVWACHKAHLITSVGATSGEGATDQRAETRGAADGCQTI